MNEAAAARFFPNERALGRRIDLGWSRNGKRSFMNSTCNDTPGAHGLASREPYPCSSV